VWEAATGRELKRMAHDSGVYAVAFSPDGRRLVSGGRGFLVVRDVAGAPEPVHLIHDSYAHKAAFSLDGRLLISGSGDGTARVWEVTTGRETARKTHPGEVFAVAFGPDGQRVTSGGGLVACVWEAATGREIARVRHEERVMVVAVSPNGRWVASGSDDAIVKVWEAATGRIIAQMEKKLKIGVFALALSPDSRWLAMDDWRSIRILEVATGREIVCKGITDDATTFLNFSPDGRWLVSGNDMGGSTQVWEAATGREVTPQLDGYREHSAVFSPDGRWVASGGFDGTARVWETVTGREVARMMHEDTVNSIAFSPDGRWVVSGSNDKTTRVWAAATGQEVARLTCDYSIGHVVFSPDGRRVASVSEGEDWAIYIWRWRPDDLIAEACKRVLRNLSEEEWKLYLPDEPYRKTCLNLP
jgi:WD40 repeat protein